MRDSGLKLQDKTILLVGPFNSVSQALMRVMTEFGADIALVNDQPTYAARFAEGINEAREARPDFGRAAAFSLPLRNENEIREALGRVVESFGRMDTMIDVSALSWNGQTDLEAALANSMKLVEAVKPFFQAKQRGRVIYIFEDASLERLGLPVVPAASREALIHQIQGAALACTPLNIAVNGLGIGVTEDFVLSRFPKSASIRKSVDEMQKSHARLKLVESNDVALAAAYFASALSGCVTGQILRLTHGFHLN